MAWTHIAITEPKLAEAVADRLMYIGNPRASFFEGPGGSLDGNPRLSYLRGSGQFRSFMHLSLLPLTS